MPELFLELFSEEIPARMQARAADDLARLLGAALAPLAPSAVRTFYGPRRIALAADVGAEIAPTRSTERGPRKTAPEQALAGFLRKHGATREQLREEGDFLVLERVQEGIAAADLIARELPALLRRFPWPKSMRWGGTSQFTWVRPLRRIVCLLDGEVVAFDLRDGADDGHGLRSGNLTEGHRFMAPGAFPVASCAEWEQALRTRRVMVDAGERRAVIAAQVAALAAAAGLLVVEDPGLLDEVAGLVEWPTALMGRIDAAYMDLPPEVMQVSMRVNQRYFALRHPDGTAAPHFVFVSNIEARDGGAVSIAGNARVLRARFSDARHFWDLDRARTLESRVAALDGVTFHAKLGSQGDRVRRLVMLAGFVAPMVGADVGKAQRAALLAKADLTTGMVAEFPELQGVMGRYYALHDDPADYEVADAVRDHYAPKGQGDAVPTAPVTVAVALADKLDQLVGFFGVGEKPSGSGDPFALRRAALGVIRMIRENALRLDLLDLVHRDADCLNEQLSNAAIGQHHEKVADLAQSRGYSDEGGLEIPIIAEIDAAHLSVELRNFILERLYVQLRSEGERHDVFKAVQGQGSSDPLTLLIRVRAVADAIETKEGQDLVAAYRRAANILNIEQRKGGPYGSDYDAGLFELDEERHLASCVLGMADHVRTAAREERYGAAMSALATLRAPLDAFFDAVTVNDPDPALRRNRLRLLSRVRATMDSVADFSKIEGT